MKKMNEEMIERMKKEFISGRVCVLLMFSKPQSGGKSAGRMLGEARNAS